MKKNGRYIAAGFIFLGIIFLFFPLDGVNKYTVMDLLALWKTEKIIPAVWLCAAAAALAGAALLECLGKEKVSLAVSLVFQGIDFISIPVLAGISAGEFALPGIGGMGAMVCLLVSAVLTGAALYKYEPEMEANCQKPFDRNPAGQQNFLQNPAGAYGYQRQPQANPRQGALYIYCGPFEGSVIPIRHMESVNVGRDSSSCNLVLEGKAVSRRHCTVTYNAVNHTYLLLDTSSNGTYLEGGQRIPKNYAVELRPGTAFYLGMPENRFKLGE